ncbi:MAG: TIGR01777 family oxidoreductase [Reichenbachiella sp.]
MIILIAGGTGLVGAHLTSFFTADGHTVRLLSRTKQKHMLAEVFEWNIDKNYIDPEALNDVEVIINLAGAGVADRSWTSARKKEIINSRIDSIRCLKENLIAKGSKPNVIINASAIGYYGSLDFEKISYENDEFGDTFLAEVCKKWENEAQSLKKVCSRMIVCRIGVVLSNRGGALPKMMQPIQYFVGSPLGSGQQIISWIHIEDLCRMISFLVNKYKGDGIFNAVGHQSVTNKVLIKTIGKKLHRPIWLPNVPSIVLKLILGEMAQIVLEGNVVSNQKILNTGFEFKFETVSDALDDLLSDE